MSEEKFEEVVRKKGGRIVCNSRKDRIVILNPHPELVRKLRESSTIQKEEWDEKYLGRRLPGSPRERAKLLEDLRKWLDDPEKGPDRVWKNRERLLWEAEFCVREGVI